jgi:LysR family transcriptional regulator, transcriptional activator of nhaA
MDWLNYHHLRYFWVVAKEGGLVPAGKVLRVSHPTLSAQINILEEQLGEALFTKVGRKLALTEMGRVVFRYADEIFTLGKEMIDSLEGRASGRAPSLNVGIVDVLPKLVVRRMLQPALALGQPVRLVCYEGSLESLLGELGLHTIDLVIADAPVPTGSKTRGFSHLLGESGLTFFGAPELAAKYRRKFPESLDGAPLLLPLERLTTRRALDSWLDQRGIRPNVVAEFEDSALLQTFGEDGLGLFFAPTAVEKEIIRRHGVQVVGRTDAVKEQFYAIVPERRIQHPFVAAIAAAKLPKNPRTSD